MEVEAPLQQCNIDIAIDKAASALGFILKPEQKRSLQLGKMYLSPYLLVLENLYAMYYCLTSLMS